MDAHDVLGKTEKGREEILKRTHRLPARTRSILVMLNGTLSVQQIKERLTVLGDVGPVLEELLADGYVARTGPTPGPLAPAAAEGANADLRRLRRALHDAAGPDADNLMMALEQARNSIEMRTAVDRATQLVQVLDGKAKAEQFGALGKSVAAARFPN